MRIFLTAFLLAALVSLSSAQVVVKTRIFYECELESERSLTWGEGALCYCKQNGGKWWQITDGAWVERLTVSPPILNIQLATLAADVTNNNGVANTIADVTGLSFPVLSGKRYKFRFVIRYTAAATTTGSRWSINGPSTTELVYRARYSLTTTSSTMIEGSTSYNLPAASNASSAATAGNLAIIEGIILPSANGTVIARFASEVLSSAIVAKAGSYVEYQPIN